MDVVQVMCGKGSGWRDECMNESIGGGGGRWGWDVIGSNHYIVRLAWLTLVRFSFWFFFFMFMVMMKIVCDTGVRSTKLNLDIDWGCVSG